MDRKLLSVLIAAAIGSPAFAGNEQIYEGPAMPVLSSTAGTETGTEAEFVPGTTVVLSESRVVAHDTGNERQPVFDGMPASYPVAALTLARR